MSLFEHLSANGSVGRLGLSGDAKATEYFANKGHDLPEALVFTNKGLLTSHMEAKTFNNDRGDYQEFKPKSSLPEIAAVTPSVAPVVEQEKEKADFDKLAGELREQLAGKGVAQQGADLPRDPSLASRPEVRGTDNQQPQKGQGSGIA